MRIPFVKYQGTGNDFVIFDNIKNPGLSVLKEVEVKRLCDRRFGIGADGLMIIEQSRKADFTMVYYNSDGNLSSMCGNGGRCIVHWAHELGYVQGDCIFEAVDGMHQARILKDGRISLSMNRVDSVDYLDGATILDTGSPHYVRLVDMFPDDFIAQAREIRYGERFRDKGININFIVRNKTGVFIRTYERGVEDETLSCGTGVTAAALVNCIEQNGQDGIHSQAIQTKGGQLEVTFIKSSEEFTDIHLIGPAAKVFEGFIEISET